MVRNRKVWGVLGLLLALVVVVGAGVTNLGACPDTCWQCPNAPTSGPVFTLLGKVGIGTDNPQKLLHIVNAGGGYENLGILLDPHGGGFVGGTTWGIDNDRGVFETIEHATCAPEFLDNPRIVVVGNCIGSPYGGNVGIGTTTPQKKLDIASRDYTNLGIRLSTMLLGGTSWTIDNNGALEIKEHVALPSTAPRTKITASRGKVTIEAVDGLGAPIPDAKVGIGTASPAAGYGLHVEGKEAGIYSVATIAVDTPRPFAVIADLNISSGNANHGGGFKAAINTSKIGAIPYILGGYFRMEDDANLPAKHLRGATVELINTEGDDYGLELKVDAPSYAIYSAGTGKVYFNGDVGIGTADPMSKLAVKGLPTTPPDGSGTAGMLCITNNGNIWIDTTPATPCQ